MVKEVRRLWLGTCDGTAYDFHVKKGGFHFEKHDISYILDQ
jgi:hypothetical protein